MQLFPAIDLRGGKVVRLTQGDYDRMTVYGEDPCAQARAFLEAGAKNLHVVDLDGAKDGTLSNYDTIAALAKQGGLYIDRKSTRLNSSHPPESRMPSSA